MNCMTDIIYSKDVENLYSLCNGFGHVKTKDEKHRVKCVKHFEAEGTGSVGTPGKT